MKKAKSTNNDPHFRYEEGKGWYIDQCYTHPELGVMHIKKKWYRTKSEAKADYPNVLDRAIEKKRKQACFARFSRQNATWEEFREAFKEDRLLHSIKGNTWYSKDRPFTNKFFEPVFKGKRAFECFTEANARLIMKSIAEAKTQYGDSMTIVDKNRAVTLFLNMLEFALGNDYLVDMDEYRHCKAVMKKIKNSDESLCGHKRPPIALTLDEVFRLVQAIEYGSMDYVLTRLLFTAGFRINEALALSVEDVDFSTDEITIKSTVAPNEDGEMKKFARTKTKNGFRTVPITDDIASILASHIAFLGLKPKDFLFPGTKPGMPLDHSAYRKRLAKYCKAAGVKVVTPHAARHTFSTIAHELGYRPEVIAKMLGHTAMVDVNIYNHLATKEKVRAMVEDMFKKPSQA